MVTLSGYAQSDYKPKYVRENDRSLLNLARYASDNGWIEFRQDAEAIDPTHFFDRFGKSVGLGPDYQMRLAKDETDFKEVRHQRFQLYYKDLPVESIEYILHSKNKRLTVVQGRMVEDLTLDVSKATPERKALEVALADRGLTIESFKGNDKIPKAELLIAGLPNSYTRQNFRLCYVFNLGAGAERADQKTEKPREPERVYIDASSGEIFRRDPLTVRCFGMAAHTAKSITSPLLPINEDKKSVFFLGGSFRPIYPNRYGSSDRPFEIEQAGAMHRLALPNTPLITRVAAGAQNPNETMTDIWNRSPDVFHNSLSWGFTNQNATTAHWLAQQTITYWNTQLARNGINGSGWYPRILVNVPPRGNEFFNAYWDNHGTIAFRNPSGANPMITADIMGHEYAHAITQATANLQYTGESGALNESISDIFGTAFERYLLPDPNTANPTNWNWSVGEDWSILRDMQTPGNRQQPSVYQGQYWSAITGNCDGFNDYCGVHTNSGVMNKWFHTLTTGFGPNNTITPISFDNGVNIVYHALRYYLQSNSQYLDAANALRMAAGALFGECSPQQRAVAAAWGAVGLPTTYVCSPDCNFAATSFTPTSVACNQAITLNTGCTVGSSGYSNGWTCQGVTYSYSGPNVPYNSSYSTSLNVTAPSTSGNYQYSLAMSKPSSGCYTPTYTFNVNVNCGSTANCDFSSGPRYVGTWNGLNVQIRQISGKNVLVTAIVGASNDKYYPRGDNFWGSFNLDPGAAGLQSCLNAGSTGWGGLSAPGTIAPPAGYYQGTEPDGAVFYAQNGSNPPNPCDMSTPRHVGTWNGLNVQIRQFPNNKRGLVTAIPGASNDKFYPRGDNFWDNFTKVAGADQYRPCLNAGDTGWWGLSFPSGITPSSGYQQGTEPDGAIFFSTNGLRVGVAEPTREDVSLVKIRPNPVQHELTVTFSLKEAGDVQVRLLDLQGRIQQNHTYKGNAGQNERVLNVASLPTGTYVLDVLLEQQRIVHKVLKQ